MSVVGIGHRRLEGAEKVAGATKFTADLELPGLLYVQLVLSHQASANIRSIDVDAARSAPGVIDIVTGADLPGVPAPSPEKPLAVGHVFYVGQPVVAVIAESEAAAADAAALVDVDYETLEITVDPDLAMREGARKVLDTEEEA
ncbi:MAG TPA: xanthine dehydrogenase family protein molybdopterin-binding subunit, partial [Candidatus Dormibacteraeota bacterium]